MTDTKPFRFWQQPWVWLGLSVDLLILDQLSKYFVRNYLTETWVVVPNWLQFRFLENPGVAFSMPVPSWFSAGLALVVGLYLTHQLATRELRTGIRLAYALILAGAIGNLIDRVLYGAVTDFISVSAFPVFNLADSFICVGVALFFWNEVMSS